MDQKRHTFPEKVRATIAKYSMLSGGEAVLIGLSGGPDSVCLLSVLHKLKDELDLKLHALYVDHGLRPGETPDEIAFCRKLCEGMSVPFAVKSIDVKTYAKEQGMNKQEAARELRYRVFDEVLADLKAGRIALGHHADDQIETFLMRFFRGAGPKGLSGIPPVRARIIRPLIETDRNEIEKFLEEQRANFVVDSSNAKEDYLRNRLRLIVVPEIRKMNPGITETVGRTMDILREEEKYFDLIVTKTLMKLICRKTDQRIDLFLTPLEAMDKVILRRVLRRAVDETKSLRGVGFDHIEEIIELIRRGRHGGRLFLPRGLRVIKEYATLVMTSEMPQRFDASSLAVPGELILKDIKAVIRASVEEKEDGYGDGKTLAVFDADKTGTGLVVRPRENGDFFCPMGFGKRKKLQDFFVDEKIPRDERGTVPIVVSGKEIVWIAGYRGDERFKVTEGTKRFLRLEFKKKI
jgi:tRNA(Ile)-lysidine synthase